MRTWLLAASVLLACEDSDDVNHGDAQRLLEGTDALCTLDLAYYEVANVAIAAWKDAAAARRLRGLIAAVAGDGGLVRADSELLEAAAELAPQHGISAYAAAYVAAAGACGAQLVSCDVRDLVSRGLALLPADALAGERGPRTA
ncbi:MAG: PIN domain-containing protein [Solirubrobacteraceae bacterium]|jgi:predicted nucleic acid-binding protein